MDRFHRGLTAGIAGGIVMNIWSFISYYILQLTDRRYLDWASVLLYGHLPINLLQTVISLMAQLLWSGFLGIVFAYFITMVTSRGYLLKGAFWGFISGFFMFAVSVLFKMPSFTQISDGTVISQFIGGVIWGLTLGYVLRRLDTTPLRGK